MTCSRKRIEAPLHCAGTHSIMAGSVALLCVTLLLSCDSLPGTSGGVVDEARQANPPVTSFPAADDDYFKDMDGGSKLSPEEVKGRNTWIVWSGGNDHFWDDLSNISYGTLDFLKTLSS